MALRKMRAAQRDTEPHASMLCDLSKSPVVGGIRCRPRQGKSRCPRAPAQPRRLNAPFENAAERWSIHHPGTISECLVRNAVERAGTIFEALPAQQRQTLTRPPPEESAAHLVVQPDSYMVPTRDSEGVWKEVKMAAIYRSDKHLKGTDMQRGSVIESRYAASLLGIKDFADVLDAALLAEAVDCHELVAWAGDGAAWVWNLHQELCPSVSGSFISRGSQAT